MGPSLAFEASYKWPSSLSKCIGLLVGNIALNDRVTLPLPVALQVFKTDAIISQVGSSQTPEGLADIDVLNTTLTGLVEVFQTIPLDMGPREVVYLSKRVKYLSGT